MSLIRMLTIAVAVLLPTSWTIAKAGEEATGSEETKTTKKSKKSKKDDGTTKTETESETKTKTDMDKK